MYQVVLELLFAMNLPRDISEKYNYLKQQTCQTLGIPFHPAVSTYMPTQQRLEP